MMIDRALAAQIARDTGAKFEIIHHCDECDTKFERWSDASNSGHLVIVNEQAGARFVGEMPWTIAIGCEGYYQLGKGNHREQA